MSLIMSPSFDDQNQVRTRHIPLHVLLDDRAASIPDGLAFRFLIDGDRLEECFTWKELAEDSRALASELVRHGATGKPVILMHPPGPAFITGLFACWYAGAIAVPCPPPRGSRHRARLESILKDSGATLALAPADQAPVKGLAMVYHERGSAATFPPDLVGDSDAPCVLQYTSGSTAAPKGVMISHGNLRSHFASLEVFRELHLKSALSWLPPYHDMGLVLKILYAFEAGIPLTFFPPDHFIQRPVRWLRAISRYRAELSGAPNFAFEMCLRSIRDEELTGLDLSCWKAAPCGAERIRAETLDRFSKRFAPYGFRPESFLPGYGLAESTLIVTASPAGRTPRLSEHPHFGKLVTSGTALPGVSLRILNTLDGEPCDERQIGEIHVKGPTVSSGYWNRPDETTRVFGAGDDRELRTGDLGYLEDGHLYVTGRLKDLIIIDGINHAPDDIESAAFSCAPEITAAAAFAVESAGRETVVLALEAGGIPAEQHAGLCERVRRAVGNNLEIPIKRVVIVRSGLLPRTTSGKIRRSTCREALAAGTLKLLFDDATSSLPAGVSPESLSVLLSSVAEVTGRSGAGQDDDIISFGVSSMEATRLAALLEARTGVVVSLGELFSARTFGSIASIFSSRLPAASGLAEIISGSEMDTDILSHAQERMWFLQQLNPESASYHVFGALEMNGPLDVAAMERAIQKVVSQHEILRSRHGGKNGRPRVWIEDRQEVPIQHKNVRSDEELRDHLTRFARVPFSLAEESPVRICIATFDANRHVLAICVHHIVADGWSIRILAGEIAATYAAFRKGLSAPGFPSRPRYSDYAASHRRWIDGGAVDSQIEYWKSKLAGHPGVLQLATDFPRPPEPSSAGDAIERDLSAELCNRVSALAKIHRGTPFMIHLAAFLLLLRRHGAGDDSVVAVPVANRNHAAAGDLIGTLVNTLPFRLPLNPAESFATLVARVRDATFEMQSAQDAPFEKIIEAVKPDRTRGHSPLAQVMFDHQEIPIAETWAGELACRPYVAHRGATQFDMSLLLTVLSDRQQMAIEYRTDLFLPETVRSMLDRHLEMLEQACREPDRPVRDITGLTDDDSRLLEKVSLGPSRPDFPTQTTPDLISKRAAMNPGRIAIISGDETLDYATLESRSNRLATALRQRGVEPGDRVGILLDRNTDLVVALLATWKAGAAYVPLDNANPPERLKLIFEDQEAMHLLVSPEMAYRLPAGTSAILLLEAGLMEGASELPAHRNSPADTAYVIYTSGSTGKPKGVVISHSALANFLRSMAESPGFTEADRLLAVTTISFDISMLEIFLPLILGGSLDLVPTATARDGLALLDRIRLSKPTVMQATPATWRLLIDAGWRGSSDLKILCGGEALDLPLAKQLVKLGGQVWNLYGPTETTVWSTIWRVPTDPAAIRIGSPIANTGIHLLADDGTPVPAGVIGQLWISGAGLADGYWERPDLTNSSFVSPSGGPRRYNTGDLARWHRDGSLECLGRSDNQVKIRGFRVELGEIEAALASHPQVAQAKVAFRGLEPTTRKLVGWVTLQEGETGLDRMLFRDYLATVLPPYMLPADIGVIGSFPLGASGKVDSSLLPNPQSAPVDEAPLSRTEAKLAEIWSELLDTKIVNRHDDWFHTGGHSLLALRLFARIHQDFRISLPLSAILEHPVLKDLATAIDETPCTPP